MRRMTILVIASLVVASCGRLGVGEPGCETTIRDPSTANILSAQAVPAAKYAPCIRGMSLAWDELDFYAESGRTGFAIYRDFTVVLRATLTESCDTTGARSVPSGMDDVERFEDISSIRPEVKVRVVPTGERPLIRARTLANAHNNTDLDGRPLLVEVDTDFGLSMRDRVNRALLEDDFVWIITEVDAEENTLEVRQDPDGGVSRGISIDEALDVMEDQISKVIYRGEWYFTFTGGCITYEFNASGRVAETIAEDAEIALGFYPLFELRRMARRSGYNVGGVESDN
jgi:hypothetical protein